jgi:hypothetical protein
MGVDLAAEQDAAIAFVAGLSATRAGGVFTESFALMPRMSSENGVSAVHGNSQPIVPHIGVTARTSTAMSSST